MPYLNLNKLDIFFKSLKTSKNGSILDEFLVKMTVFLKNFPQNLS